MPGFWAEVRRIGFRCRCHCHTCIENRHVQVRRISAAIARIRSGQGFHINALEAPSAPWQRRYFRGSSGLWVDASRKDHGQQAGNSWFEKDGRRTTADSTVEQSRRRREELELKEAASELQSLSIDHWSIDDVVTYEPRPGGRKPPAVPSTTTADPNLMMPQSPWASDSLKRQNYARVWTRKKIAKMETAIARFAVRVCRLLELDSQWPSNLIVLPEAIRPIAKLAASDQVFLEKQLSYRINVLRNRFGDVPPNHPPEANDKELGRFIPKYEHFEDGLHHELLRDLNASLVELFEGYKHQQLDFRTLMVKICHNLLVSSAPPNVQTMNILLLGFYSCDRYLKLSSSHVRHLILDWLIQICFAVKIRPNEVTCATVLATYRRRGMRHAFAQFVMLMRGLAGPHALMYTKELTLTRESAPRLIPTKSNPKIFKQAVYPSPMIFAEVIKGVAKFYTLEDAVTICKDFTAKEWGYDWSCLHYLLNACIIQKDWQSGLWVWDEIKAFRTAGHEEPIRILAAMLALCVQCQKEEKFAEVLAYSTIQLKRITQPAFVDIATEILDRAVERMDDDELFAMENDEGLGVESAEHERFAFESRVQRRLKDDPAFRHAVFGFGYDPRTLEEKRDRSMQYFDAVPMSEEYRFRNLDLDQRACEPEDENESLEGTQEDRAGIDAKHDLLEQAAGGDDVDESESDERAPSPPQLVGKTGEEFDTSPMDLGDTAPVDLERPSSQNRD